MKLQLIAKVSPLALALALVGCGGDININENATTTPTAPNPSTPTSSCPAFASTGSAIAGNAKPVCELAGTITSNITLTSDILWSLNGRVAVGDDNANSATLTIQPGTTLFGQSGADFLVVSRGSKINAAGSETAPIVMTSLQDMLGNVSDNTSGQWGGLVLLGKAITNSCADPNNCTVQAEGDAGPYGGNDPADNSGVLRYLQVRYSGYEVLPDNELNGITFAAVGSGTTVDHVEVMNSSDDGIELFGGSVNLRNIVLLNNEDDSLDWTDGWNGKAQFVYVQQSKGDFHANRGIEGDGNKNDNTAQPFTNPTIANMTIIGNNYDGDDDSEGVLLREGTQAHLYNFIVTGPSGMGECFEINNQATVDNLNAGNIVFRNSIIDCTEPFKNPTDANGNPVVDLQSWFTDPAKENIVGDAQLGGYTPAATSPALGNGYDVANKVDAWFQPVNYIGAFDGTHDWTLNWTKGIHAENPALASCPTGTTQVASVSDKLNCQVTGTITTDMILPAGADYVLSGKVTVGNDNADSATLTIAKGVRVFGKGTADFLVVSRGSKIMAEGTAAEPIVFTSVQDVIGATTGAGQWGGMVLLGNAPTNQCSDLNNCSVQAEGDAGPYGGPDTADNSGTLKYVVIKYAGYEVLPDNELNGLTLGGVGAGTTIDFLQVHKNLDDGIELWGGNVNLKHIVLTSNGDDSLDWSDGWQGKAQYVLVKQDPNDEKANRGIEGDNLKANPAATPLTEPTVANMTIIGNSYNGNDDSEGILLREGSAGKLYNFIVTGPAGMGECLEFNGAETNALAANGTIIMNHSVIACAEPFKSAAGGVDVQNWFTSQVGNSVLSGGPAAVLNGIYTIDATSPADLSADSFFDQTSYIGAVSQSEDWTANWAVALH